MKKTKHPSVCGPFPVCTASAPSPPTGFGTVQGQSCFTIPASRSPISVPWPGALCPAPGHTQPFLGCHLSPPFLSLWPTSSRCPQQDRHLWCTFACGVFLQTPYPCWCWSWPWLKEVPPSPLPSCPGQNPEAFVPALGEIDGNRLFAFYLFSFLSFFPVHFLWSVPILCGNLSTEYVTSCDAVGSVCVQWRRGHLFVR